MIYCVVPKPLAGELYDKLADYYKDESNVEVIVDRRAMGGQPGDHDAFQNRRRQRAKGSFDKIEPPSVAT
jgi:hypothetical protein